MILSHRHKFIFIRTAKTASSSMELALEGLCGREDICPPFQKGDKQPAGYAPRNYRGPFLPRFRKDMPLKQLGRDLKDLKLGRRYWNHMSAFEVRTRAGAQVFDGYFKFCFERNPWDRMVSSFFWEKSRVRNCPQDFATYIRSWRARENFELYTYCGKVMVDFIGRYENIEHDWKEALARAGIDEPPQLGNEKSQFRPRGESYRDYYTPETRDIVAKRYASTIALLGYAF
ncbi:MAG TPA: sulfotransferase family 2 domain-containing protein [Rhizomicrobium sp.]|jgi:hypothetical protein